MDEEKQEVLSDETEFDQENLADDAENAEDVSEEPAEEKEEQIVPEQGISTDRYDVSEPWLDGKKVDDSVTGIKIHYDLTGDEVKTALRYFQKGALYRKNTIFTVILAVIAILYGQAIFKNPEYTMGYIMLVLSLSVIFFMWFMPARYIKSAAQAAELAHDSYELEFCQQGMLMPQEDGKYLVSFTQSAIRATEFPTYYLIIASKEKVFVLPKRCIPEEDQQELTAILKDALGARYELVTE